MDIIVTSVMVTDQEKALQFYTNILGFEKKHDIPVGGDARWLTLLSPGGSNPVELLLEPMVSSLHKPTSRPCMKQASRPRLLGWPMRRPNLKGWKN